MQNSIIYISDSLKPYYPETEISAFLRLIASHVTGLSYSAFLADRSKKLTEEQQQKIEEIVDRLKTYEPIQYILEETEFFGLPFYVDQNVLIPRPETEELVELIINDNQNKEASILDIGTGSGCIAIALAKYLKNTDVSAWDISYKAIDVAVVNSKRNSVDVSFKRVDVLGHYPTDKRYDIIVSNPPYVLESEKGSMQANVLDYEPHSALFVPDNRALLFYERIADVAIELLNKGGYLYFEINQAKGEETVRMLEEKGFSDVTLLQDISKRDRMVKARLR
jgi:release factor glutamine methyltransferase